MLLNLLVQMVFLQEFANEPLTLFYNKLNLYLFPLKSPVYKGGACNVPNN